MLAANDQDFSSRQKLRFVRFARVLCRPDSKWKTGLMVTILNLVESLLYAVLTKRATLADLCGDGDDSIEKCQRDLFNLLRGWCTEDDIWLLFRSLGGSFADGEQRRWSRRFIIEISAGMHDHFGLRIRHPPYSLLCMNRASTPMRHVDELIDDVLARPTHCLSIFCKQLVVNCPNHAAMKTKGKKIIGAFGKTCVHAIDPTERSHNHMRTNLRSSGPARSVTFSANKTLLGEVRAEHIARDGQDPSAPPKPCDTEVADTGSESKRTGSTYFVFRNIKVTVWKRLHAPDRPIEEHERIQLEGNIKKEWLDLSDEERDNYIRIHQARAMDKHIAQVEVEQAGGNAEVPGHEPPPPPPEKEPLFQAKPEETVNGPVPVSAIKREHKGQPPRDRKKKAWADPDLLVKDVPERVKHMDFEGKTGTRFVQGCYWEKNTVCRAMLSVVHAPPFEALVRRLTKMVDSFGPSKRSTERLILMRGERQVDVQGVPTTVCRDMCVVLARVRESPKVQLFVRCILSDGGTGFDDDAIYFTFPSTFPITVRLAAWYHPVMDFGSMHFISNEDLCLEMVKWDLTSNWAFHNLNWVFGPRDGDDVLLEMVIDDPTKVDAAFIVAKKKRTTTPKPIPKELSPDADPFAIGARMAAKAKATPTPAPATPTTTTTTPSTTAPSLTGVDSDSGEEVVCEPDPDAEFFVEDDDRFVIEDWVDEFDHHCGGGLDLDDVALNGDGETDDECESDPEAEKKAVDVLYSDGIVVEESDDRPVEVAVPPPEEAASSARISEVGYVSSRYAPWCHLAMLGRITDFPKTVEVRKRKVVCRCYMHTGCQTRPVARLKVEDHVLLTWLFSAKPDTGSAAAHMELWGNCVPRVGRPPAPPPKA